MCISPRRWLGSWVEDERGRVSDERLRSTERRWRETRTREDGQVLLVELQRAGAPPPQLLRTRVEVGDLAEDRLRLAALLGDAHAQEALGGGVPRGALKESVIAWVAELGAWGPDPWPRIALAVVRLLDREFAHEEPPGPWLARAGALIEALLADRGSVKLGEVLRLHDAISPDLAHSTRRVDVADLRGRARWYATISASRAVEAAQVLVEGGALDSTRSAARAVTHRAVDALTYTELALRHTSVQEDLSGSIDDAQPIAHERVRAAVQGALLPWALVSPAPGRQSG